MRCAPCRPREAAISSISPRPTGMKVRLSPRSMSAPSTPSKASPSRWRSRSPSRESASMPWRPAPPIPECCLASPARRRTRQPWRRRFPWVASVSPRKSPMASCSLRRTTPASSRVTSSMSMADTAPTDHLQARRFAPRQPEGIPMTQHTHQTAVTQYIEAKGIRFAYRRFGKAGGVPLVLFMHFTGTMDHWDPAVTDGLARDREVILFDNAGISSSSGEVPNTIEGMAADAAAFIKTLGLRQVDLLGFSIGGTVTQALTLAEPQLVRRLVLVGTGPRSGEGMATLTPEAQSIFGKSYEEPDHLWLRVHFSTSEQSQAAGRQFLERFR